MLVTAMTLAIIGFAVRALAVLVKEDGSKFVAALHGRSWAAEPRAVRPIQVKFNSLRTEEPAWRPELRAAA